jgi:hypothetical protein
VFLSLFAIVSTRARLATLKGAPGSFVALIPAWLAIIVLEAARWPALTIEAALRPIIALEVAAALITARWWPVAGVVRVCAAAIFAAFRPGLVVPALMVVSLLKRAPTRLEGARA